VTQRGSPHVIENLPMRSQRHRCQVITRNTRFLVPQECVEDLTAVLGANLRWKRSQSPKFGKHFGEDKCPGFNLGSDTRVEFAGHLQVGRRGLPGEGGSKAYAVDYEIELNAAEPLKSETLPNAQQVNCGQQLDVLLSEVVRITR